MIHQDSVFDFVVDKRFAEVFSECVLLHIFVNMLGLLCKKSRRSHNITLCGTDEVIYEGSELPAGILAT